MSLNYDSLSALTRDKFIPVLVDNIFNSNVLAFKLLKNAEKLDGGKKILTPLEYGMNTAQGYYSGYDVLDTTPSDPITSAEWNWKLAYATISISGEDELKNSGDSQVLSLLKSKMRNAEKSLKDMFGNSLFGVGDATVGNTAPDSNEITALSGASYDTSASSTDYVKTGADNCIIGFDRELGGIDSTTYTWWDAQSMSFQDTDGTDESTWTEHLDNTNGVSQIVQDMTKMYGKCTIDNDSPDLIVTTQVLMDAYESSLQANKRFEGSSDLADAGFQTLRFKGATVVVDSHVPDGCMYFLNTKYLDFKVHSKRNFSFEDFQKPVNQDSRVAKIFWMGNLTCTNPRMQGVIVGGDTDYA
ncbi:MAG: putative major head protein [Prokaryotic dsDNA virus sp.]|nr:MAG: putative major head protein [Prokaryotic dsDNA virus sp.]QDP59864.1 MAG: putative major head protein [Prokaryotic dsDNA virus sp.]|tara:strand:+ start:10320 stop:11390 length:1071 start_codon:yes stop_codon:yes gene_type:complete